MDDEEGGISQEAANDQNAANETNEQSESARGVSYHDRMRAEPEFAVEEIRKKDSYIGQLNQRMSKLKDIEQYVNALGSADALIELAAFGNQIRSNPQLQKAIEAAANGRTMDTPSEPEVELFDPEVKAVYDKFQSRYEKQEQIIQDLQSRLNRTEVQSVKGTLRENMEQALSRFQDDPETLAEAKESIMRAIESAEKAAANGDRSAAMQLDLLASPGGVKTLRMYTLDNYDRYVEKRLASNAPRKPDGAALKSKATDERHTARSAPPSDVVSVKTGAKVTSQLARQVLEDATSKHGKDPRSFWN